MPRALRTCSVPGCPEVVTGGRCPDHAREAERRRGTARQRGYDKRHEAWAARVLRRHPTCQWPGCTEPSRHADHHPRTVRELQAAGVDPWPADGSGGRGLCHPHHSLHTAAESPGGWNIRT